MKQKLFDVIGTILLFIGFFLALLPHAFHAKIGLVQESHTNHIIQGIILIVIALIILIWSNKALKLGQKHLNNKMQ